MGGGMRTTTLKDAILLSFFFFFFFNLITTTRVRALTRQREPHAIRFSRVMRVVCLLVA